MSFGRSREPISLRLATKSDVEAVLDVQRRSPGRSASSGFREHVAAAIEDSTKLVLVAEADAFVVAWAMASIFDEPDGLAPAGGYLTGVTVAPDSRRQGIGGRLVTARLDWVRQHDSRAFFFANALNTASIEMHQRLGFRPIARGKSFHGVSFEGGTGILFVADLTQGASDGRRPLLPTTRVRSSTLPFEAARD